MKICLHALTVFFAATLMTVGGLAQSGKPSTPPARADYRLYGAPLKAAAPDPAIAAALREVSSARIQKTITTLVGFGTRSTLSSMETDLPPGQGVTAAADWIYGQFEQISKECGGCLEVKRDTFVQPVSRRVARPTTITNVYAILRGKDARQAARMYLVTGHYDSRDSDNNDDHGAAPGANDDASGVAVSLECARVLSQAGVKQHWPASLVFVAVAGEEQGLYGSAHLAQVARAEGWQLEGVLNNDIVGGNTTPGDTLQLKDRIRVFSEGVPATATPEQARRIRALGLVDDAPSRQLARAVALAGQTYLNGLHGLPDFSASLVARPDRYLRGGDHTSFNQQGFAAVRLTEWREDFNHQHQNVRVEDGVQYGDLIGFVDFHYVANVARLNAATLAMLAASPGAPTEFKIHAEKLENGTTLSWKAPEFAAGGQAHPGFHYELVWRRTDAADWEYGKTVAAPDNQNGEVTITVPVSKDNVIFGVRTVDDAGHASLVTTVTVPQPAVTAQRSAWEPAS
uniref:Peptidase M28 n=1 Tax=mine drainage metagenome TaxID=410659 RepID=E6Q0B6_9ZZZZ